MRLLRRRPVERRHSRIELAEQLVCWNCPARPFPSMGIPGARYLDPADGVRVVDIRCPVCGDRWTVREGL